MCQAVGKCARLQANVPGCRRICQAARLQAAGECAKPKLKGPVTGVETSNWGKNGEELHRCIVDSSAVVSAFKGIGFVHHCGLEHLGPASRAWGPEFKSQVIARKSVSSRIETVRAPYKKNRNGPCIGCTVDKRS